MKLLVLDPGLSARAGHNAAMLEELALQATASPALELACATAAGFDAAAFGDIGGCDWQPVFRVHGYARFLSDSASHEALLQRLTALCLEDLERLDLRSPGLLLMPTAYPIHLAALARCLPRSARLRVGLLMPPRFWACDARAAQWLAAVMREAIAALRAHPGVRLHSDVPQYRIDGALVPTEMLLPPLADATAQWMAAQRVPHDDNGAARPLRFGFFGEPSARKGFGPLLACLRAGLPPGAQVVLALPPGHAALAAQLEGVDGVSARALPADNRSYLQALAEVDVVLLGYDPAVYDAQMSGIAAEAIALGKPLLVSAGCDAILDFLARHAPGSFLCCGYGEAGLRQGLAAPRAAWHACRTAALAASGAVLALKRMAPYLG